MISIGELVGIPTMTLPSDSNDRRDATTPIDRRRYLKYTGSAGLGGLGLTTVGTGVTFGGDTVDIVFTRDEDGPAVTKEVPGEWYTRALRSRQVQDALKEQYGGQSWLGSVGRRASAEEVGGLSTFDINVGARDVDAAKRALPDEIDGFTIDVRGYEEPDPHSWCNTYSYYCVPGGAYVVVEQNDGDLKAHSAACIAKNSSGYVRYLTCAHGFLADCGDDIKYNKLWQGSDRNYVGYVTSWHDTQDWALVRESSYSEVAGINNKIISASPDVRGWVTEDGIDYLISTDYTTYQYGARTCRSSDELRGDDWYWWCGGWTKRGNTYTDAISGDSGSPHYIYYDGYVYLIGPHFGHDPVTGFRLPQLAYRIHDAHGITFGSTYDTC